MNQRERLAFGHLVRELYVRLFQRAPKTAHSIAVLPDIFAFRFIQDVANVSAGIAVRLDDADEILNQLLEEYVVLPQRVVGINQQCMTSHRMWRLAAFARGSLPPNLFSRPQSTSRMASSAMAVAAPGRPRLFAASRILATFAESSSSAAIFHAAAGKLLQRIAAPVSSKWSALRPSWPGIGSIRAMGSARESASEVVSPPALPTIKSAAAMYLSISVVNPTGQSLGAPDGNFPASFANSSRRFRVFSDFPAIAAICHGRCSASKSFTSW